MGNPQAFNRYSYALNGPTGSNDPTGHMTCNQIVNSSGPVSEEDCQGGIDYQNDGPIPGTQNSLPVNNAVTSAVETTLAVAGTAASEALDVYSLGWQNFGSAWSTYWNPNATYGQKFSAGFYMGAWGGAHVMFGLGVAGLGCAATGPGCVSAVEGILGIGTVASANGHSTNEIQVLGKLGEVSANIIKNTKRIPSLSQTASYRIPDQLLPAQRLLTEVKNVSQLSRTSQIVDFVMYSQQMEYTFELWTRSNTSITGPLQTLIDSQLIVQRFLP